LFFAILLREPKNKKKGTSAFLGEAPPEVPRKLANTKAFQTFVFFEFPSIARRTTHGDNTENISSFRPKSSIPTSCKISHPPVPAPSFHHPLVATTVCRRHQSQPTLLGPGIFHNRHTFSASATAPGPKQLSRAPGHRPKAGNFPPTVPLKSPPTRLVFLRASSSVGA